MQAYCEKNEYLLYRLLPLMAYCGFIFFLSSQELVKLKAFILFPGEDKLLHMVEYGILGVLLLRSFAPYEGPINHARLCVFWGTLYGWSDEYHQGFVPGRESDFCDLLADVTGLALVSLLYLMVKRREEKEAESKITRHIMS